MRQINMKKHLLGLVALLAAGAASAESGFNIWGVVDAAASHYSLGGVSVSKETTSGTSSSQLGFKGQEDLGGGLGAGFWLEAGLLNNNGSVSASSSNNQSSGSIGGGGMTFNRRSTVGLSSDWGELRLGRDVVPTRQNIAVYDPFSTVGAASVTNILQPANGSQTGGNFIRSSNTVQYLYGFGPNANATTGKGIYVSAMASLGNNASNSTNSAKQPNEGDGRYYGLRVGYAQDDFSVAVATAKDKLVSVSDYTYTNVGGAYHWGNVRLSLILEQNKDGMGDRFNAWNLGARIVAGPGYIPISYSVGKANDAIGSTASQFGIGYVYMLSKRTALYGTFSHLNNKTGTLATFGGGNGSSSGLSAAAGSGNGFDIGLTTRF